jgi:hypothetical protein
VAEPTSSSSIFFAVFGASAAAMFPGIDGNAMIGAFCGGGLVVLSRKDSAWPTRIAYGVISMALGYMAVPDVVRLTPIHTTSIAAALVSAMATAIIQIALDKMRSIDIGQLVTNIFRRGG